MAKIGYRSYVGFGQESSFGSIAQPTNFVEYNSESFNKEIEEILIDAINGTPQYKKRVTGNQSVSGALEFPVVPGAALKIFQHVIGSVTTSTLTTGVYQHVFLARTSALSTYMTFQICRDTDDTSSSQNYSGCKFNNLGFNIAPGEILKCSAEIMGKDEAAANTISTASYRTYNPYVFTGATIKIGNDLASATTTAIQNWSLAIANNLLDDRVLGSATRNTISEGMMDVSYEITQRFDDTSLYTRFTGGTRSYISAVFVGASISALYNHQITFESYNCYFNGGTGNIGSPGEFVYATYPIRAIFDAASSSCLKVTVITDLTTT